MTRTEEDNRCPRCQSLYPGSVRPSYFGSDPVCAFRDGIFVPNGHNWQCATANAIRSLLYESGDSDLTEVYGVAVFKSRRDDRSAGLIFAESVGWTFVSYYKDRGGTDGMWTEYGSPLRLDAAEKLIQIAEQNGFKANVGYAEVSPC